MSTGSDLVLSAIAGGAHDRAAIAEQTGLDPKTISNRLWQLKHKGAIAKGEKGWQENAPETGAAGHADSAAPSRAASAAVS